MVSDALLIMGRLWGPGLVSIRFEVRGGFRQPRTISAEWLEAVSIRFEVRGGFRLMTES